MNVFRHQKLSSVFGGVCGVQMLKSHPLRAVSSSIIFCSCRGTVLVALVSQVGLY